MQKLKPRTIAVVVLGELARSPRMINHARELAAAGYTVWLVGYQEREFGAPDGVRVQPLRAPRRCAETASRMRFLFAAGLRMAGLFFELTAVLLRLRPRAILVQNPPAFPTLAAASIAARTLRAPLLLDWHNYGYSMLALRLGGAHAATRLAARYEIWAGSRAAAHLCVSEAMRIDLEKRFAVRAQVLYDRPLALTCAAQPLRSPLVAVCPSGWTADEDMTLLLDALELLDTRDFEFHLTGDGPCRRSMETRIAALRERGFAIQAGFLSPADYHALLQRASLGLSLHRSSSGVDLPMKIVDLFGAGVPVCALDYGAALGEQVAEGETGFLFRTAAELAALLERLARQPASLDDMRRAVRARWNRTWHEEWRDIAAPLLGVSGGA